MSRGLVSIAFYLFISRKEQIFGKDVLQGRLVGCNPTQGIIEQLAGLQ